MARLQRLIRGHGAVDVVIPGMLPVGCFPVYLTLYATSSKKEYDEAGCLNKYNNFAKYHNLLLQQQISLLQTRYPSARIRYADYYNPALRFVSSPAKYGDIDIFLFFFLFTLQFNGDHNLEQQHSISVYE